MLFLDPYTRYVNLNNKVVSPHQVTSYYVSDRPVVAPNNHTEKLVILGNADKREQQKEASQNTLTRKGNSFLIICYSDQYLDNGSRSTSRFKFGQS